MLFLDISQDDELGHDLDASLPYSPDIFFAFLSEEVVDDFLIEKVFSYILGKRTAAVYYFLLYAHT
jgi:hypothetical protein